MKKTWDKWKFTLQQKRWLYSIVGLIAMDHPKVHAAKDCKTCTGLQAIFWECQGWLHEKRVQHCPRCDSQEWKPAPDDQMHCGRCDLWIKKPKVAYR